MKSQNQGISSTPIGDVGGTAGYADISPIFDESEVGKAAHQYLNDSLLINQLTERVYELLLEDLRYQRQRKSNYGPQRWL